MITLYTIDPARALVTHLQADLTRRTVEAATRIEPTPTVHEFSLTGSHPDPRAAHYAEDHPFKDRQTPGTAGTESTWTAADLMTRPCLTGDSTLTVGQALERLQEHGIHHLPVTQAGTIIALLHERDLLTHDAHQPISTLSSPYLVVLPSTPASAIALTFLTKGFTACLVRTTNGLDAILTEHDLLKALLPPRVGSQA